MSSLAGRGPATLATSLLAALTTWVTLLAWTPFAEEPSGFMRPILLAALLVALVGMLLRSARVPAALVFVLQLLTLGLWLQQRLAPGTALGGVLPTGDTVATLSTVLYDAGVTAQRYSAPVPASAPELYPMLVVAGACTALLVDLLAVGLRRAPLAGLPLLAAYTAPVSILAGGVPAWKFAVAAACFVLLVAADQERRLMHWGQHLTPGGDAFDRRGLAGAGAVWGSARKIGLTATALALVAPLLVPSFSASFFGGGSGPGSGGGDEVSISNPMVDLKRDLVRGADVDLVEVRTDEPDPAYLRLTVLNGYDGNAWRPTERQIPTEQRADGSVTPPPGLDKGVRTRRFSARVDVSRFFTSRWLPAPYPVASINAPGDWRWDRSTLDFVSADEDENTAGLSYRLAALQVSPSARQLANAGPAPLDILTPYTFLPDEFPKEVEELARSVVNPDASRFEQAVALQQWFRQDGGFEYSLDRSSGNGSDDLVRFLREGDGGRVGYCEQFAAAMAVMGRSIGIPSRVAVGFLRPERTGRDTYVYSTHDLHSWPELYFDGVGWVRFEPTPQDRATGVPSYTTQELQPTDAPTSSAPTAAGSANQLNRSPDRPTDQAGQDEASSGVGALPVVLVSLLALTLLALVPRATTAALRRRRWSAAVGSPEPRAWVESAWSEISDTARDLRLAWDDRVTLRSAAHTLVQGFADPDRSADDGSRSAARGAGQNPVAEAALRRIVGWLERGRYARSLPDDAVTVRQVRADLDACLAAMAAGAGRDRRRLARWLPVSLAARLRTGRRERVTRVGPLVEAGVDRAQ